MKNYVVQERCNYPRRDTKLEGSKSYKVCRTAWLRVNNSEKRTQVIAREGKWLHVNTSDWKWLNIIQVKTWLYVKWTYLIECDYKWTRSEGKWMQAKKTGLEIEQSLVTLDWHQIFFQWIQTKVGKWWRKGFWKWKVLQWWNMAKVYEIDWKHDSWGDLTNAMEVIAKNVNFYVDIDNNFTIFLRLSDKKIQVTIEKD